MEKPSETPPFWVQPGNTPRRMRRTSGVIVAILLLVAAAILLFLAVPSILSLLVHIFKPNTVKRGWDTLNLVLVLFAIVCGFLGRNSGDAETPVADRSFSTPSQRRRLAGPTSSSSSSTPRYWFKSPDRTPMLRRNSSSYPELRQETPWTVAPEDQWRFSDDTLVSQYRVWGYDSDRLRRQLSNREVDGWYFADTPISGRLPDGSPAATPPSQPQPSMRVTEEKPDDSENGSEKNTEPEVPPHTSRTPPEPRSPAAPATPPSLKVRRRRAKHSLESQPRRDWARNPAKSVSDVGNMDPVAAESPPPPPQQPGSGSGSRLGQTSRKSDRKRVGLSSSSSSTKEFFASLYHQRKRKRKQRQKSVDDLESVLRFSPATASTTPPPPPSLFQNLFASKKAKSKRTHSIPPPPSPPPNPPLPPVRSTINALKHESRRTLAQSDPEPLTEHKPPVRMAESFVSADEGVNSGGESPSPWIPIPPPTPPPPPFRVPELKFAAVGGGDFVRLLSEWSFSSRSASPEPDQSDPEPTEESGSSTAAAAFCPSPDVDTKADSFIARFRAGLRLEKVNSANEKQGLGLSGLGPRPGPDPKP